MIKQSDDFTTVSAMRGGEGCARIFRAPLPEKAAPLAMASRIELEPGASIGVHKHETDEEVYAIVSGNGVYTSDDGDTPALPGDIFVTRKGMSHGLRNNGGEPLIFFAVVAE